MKCEQRQARCNQAYYLPVVMFRVTYNLQVKPLTTGRKDQPDDKLQGRLVDRCSSEVFLVWTFPTLCQGCHSSLNFLDELLNLHLYGEQHHTECMLLNSTHETECFNFLFNWKCTGIFQKVPSQRESLTLSLLGQIGNLLHLFPLRCLAQEREYREREYRCIAFLLPCFHKSPYFLTMLEDIATSSNFFKGVLYTTMCHRVFLL